MLSCSLALAQAPNTYDLNPGNGNGLRFWSADSYKIHMGNAAEYKYGPVTDYSIKMNMSNTATRGWTWGVQNTVPIAALSTLGHMQIAGNFFAMGKIGIGLTNPTEKFEVNGAMNVNGNIIYLQTLDHNHGLGYFHTYTTTGNYANKDFDGPVLFGWAGGGLGTNRGSDRNVALSWNYLGQVGIGSKLEDPSSSGYMLLVNGDIRAKRIVVETGWSDFVFEKNYKLSTLQEVEKYIQQYGHLPEIPSANEIECNGGDLGELVKLQMQKIEELTLYIIQQNKRIEALENK